MLDKSLLEDLALFIENNYVEEKEDSLFSDLFKENALGLAENLKIRSFIAPVCDETLEDYIRDLDLSFSESVLDIIKKNKYDDVDVYKRAGIDRKVFSKLRNDKHYVPSRNTAIALCIGLKLDIEETEALLSKAGFALSESSLGDVIVKYFITHGRYDIYDIDEALLKYDQKTLMNY